MEQLCDHHVITIIDVNSLDWQDDICTVNYSCIDMKQALSLQSFSQCLESQSADLQPDKVKSCLRAFQQTYTHFK